MLPKVPAFFLFVHISYMYITFQRLDQQTVDAAINSGNSGGPALSDSKVVGVAFQSFAGDADNIGQFS